MVVVELTCFTWSLANISFSFPFLEREGIEDNFQFGRAIDILGADSRQQRTVDEASMFFEVVSNLVRSTFDHPISSHVNADLCAPLILLLPLFFIPNLLPTPKDNSVPSASPSTAPPTLLAQYTIRPNPPVPPTFWQPHRNMTGLTQDQGHFQGDVMWPSKPTVEEEEVIWSTFQPDSFDWNSEEEETVLDAPTSEDVVNRPALGYGLPRAEDMVNKPALSYGLPRANVQRPSEGYGTPEANVVKRPSLVYGTPRVTKDLENAEKTSATDSTVSIGPQLPPSHSLSRLEDKVRLRGHDLHQGKRQGDDARDEVRSRPPHDKYRVFGAPRTPQGRPQAVEKSPQRVTLESLHNEDYDQINDPFNEPENLYNNLWEKREGSPDENLNLGENSESPQLTRYGAQLKRTLGENPLPLSSSSQLKRTLRGNPLRKNKVWRRKRLTDH